MAAEDELPEEYPEIPAEYQPPDIQAALLEKQKDAFAVGYPSKERVKSGLASQVGRLAKGAKVTPTGFTLDQMEIRILSAWEKGLTEPTLEELDPTGTYIQATMSEGGKSRHELVEIARLGRQAEARRGLFGRLFR